MDNNMESMLDVYLFEANDLLEHLDEILLNCEKQNAFDTDSINEIFRIMHTIKGSSAMMQFSSLATISHKVEDLFFYVRDNGIDASHNDELFDLMFKSSDFIKDEIAKVENNEPLTTDIGTFEEEINNFLKKISSGEAVAPAGAANTAPAAQQPAAPAAETPAQQTAPAPAAASASATADLTPEQKAFLKTQEEAGLRYALQVTFDEEEMQNLRALILVSSIMEYSPEITYYPKEIQSGELTADMIAKHGFIICTHEEQDLKQIVKTVEQFTYTKNYTVLNTQESAVKKPAGQKAAPASGRSATPAPQKEAPKPQTHQVVKQNLINVNLTKLDNLMDLVGEIITTESMVTSVFDMHGQDLNISPAVSDTFEKNSRHLRKLTGELQEVTMSIRMVPVSGVFQKMNRIVRDMCKKLDKDVELVLVGEETEVDKTVVDSISDPIMHLVRNSMDHGIETKEERAQTDKSPKGKVTLSAQNTGGEILITVEDDGKGIDKDYVLQKAKRQGMLTKPEGEYTSKEIYNFLLMPGFSTNEVVTEFSGRGVGMDVVKKNVEKIGGDVTMHSELGVGTKTIFKIPLTLAIVNGMKVQVGSTVFTVPINNIRQSFKVEPDQIIHDTDQNEIIMVRDEYYPLVRLHKAYDIDTDVTELTNGIVMLVETRESAYCLFADYLLGEQQVVVKSLPGLLSQYDIKKYGVGGCTILGDGSISLILDVQNLYNSFTEHV